MEMMREHTRLIAESNQAMRELTAALRARQ
jgi:hypothetical protein